jgi:iron complex outermembrane receptor protein
MSVRLLVVLILICTSTNFVFGQEMKGQVVNGQTGKAVPFGTIYFVDRETIISCDSSGNWLTADLANGQYHVVVKALGFKTLHADIYLHPDSIIQINIQPIHFELDKVIVSNNGYLHRESITNVESLDMNDISRIQSTTLAQTISEIPGVYQTGIGVGIGKPVIRGLSGSSVVTYVNGLRIQNQQWGDDHGLPVTSVGIGSVEVIKGPASLLYGADALGGVLYFVDEPYVEKNTISTFFSTRFESNSLGTVNQAGLKYAKDKFRINFYAAYDNFADYEVPNGRQVLNSRFNQASSKLAIGYAKKRWVFDLRYNFYQGRIGLPGHTHDSIPDVTSFLTTNQNRDRNVPAQVIQNHFLSVENKFFFNKHQLYVTLGNTNNNLKEHEEKFFFPDIIMNLNNSVYNVKWRYKISRKVETIMGSQGMFQLNRNGAEAVEFLIPNSNTADAGVYGLVKFKHDKYNFLIGARIDNRVINANDNFNKNYFGFNYSAGLARLGTHTTTRINLSSGFRAPNTSELLSDGIHHGSFRYELGNENLETEKAVQVDASLAVHLDDFEFILNPFYNYIQNYIYLQAMDSVIEQFDVYGYTQADFAQLYGVDIGLHYHPHKAHWLHFESSFSNVFAEDINRKALPLIPQTRLNNQIKVDFNSHKKFSINNLTVQYQYFFKQNRLGLLETE